MTRLLALALCASAAAAQPPAAVADSSSRPAPSGAGWGAVATAGLEAFETDRAPWRRSAVAVQRRWPSGALALEAGSTSRNGESAPFAALDAYRTLGGPAYGNVRVKAAPGAVTVARADVLGEAYVWLGGGLEGSLGVRHLLFEADRVTLGQASLASYRGKWVGRLRAVVVPAERTAVSVSASLRYLVEGVGGLTAPYVQVTVGQGQEPVVERSVPAVRQSFVADLRAQVGLGRSVGASLGASWTEDGALTRWGLDAALVVRR